MKSISVPGWDEWKIKSVGYTLNFDDPIAQERYEEARNDFELPKNVKRRQNVVMQYLALADSVEALKECQYYFRRYPFYDLPVGKYRHLTHVCEMYFSRFYEVRERIKVLLNSINLAARRKKIDAGKYIKIFDKTFGQEIRARHGIHHRKRFEDVAIDRLYLAEVIAPKLHERFSHKQYHIKEYRRLSREWANRVKAKGRVIDEFLEMVAKLVLENCKITKAD